MEKRIRNSFLCNSQFTFLMHILGFTLNSYQLTIKKTCIFCKPYSINREEGLLQQRNYNWSGMRILSSSALAVSGNVAPTGLSILPIHALEEAPRSPLLPVIYYKRLLSNCNLIVPLYNRNHKPNLVKT